MARLNNISSFHENSDHAFDNLKNTGYNYNLKLLSNVVSPEIFGNIINDTPLRQLEKLIQELVNQVKRIKLTYAIAYDKHSKLIN